MNWIILILAGMFEVGWAIGLKYTEGFTRLWPTVWTAGAMVVSLLLLGIAMKGIPVGTAYSGKCRATGQRRADHHRHHRPENLDAVIAAAQGRKTGYTKTGLWRNKADKLQAMV